MKAIIIICIALLIMGSSCKRTIDSTTDLPFATQTGTNTFAARVNGEKWLAGFDFRANSSPLELSYYNGKFSLTIRVDNNDRNPKFDSQLDINIIQGQTYQLQATSTNPYAMELNTYFNGGVGYAVRAPLTGEMVITKYDSVNGIISGSLSFDLISSAGERITVRDGWFDAKYK